MNSKIYLLTVGFLLFTILTLLITGCHVDEQATPDFLDANYGGTLTVIYTNVYPPWAVSKIMDVYI